MFRELTFTDANRADAMAEGGVSFVMDEDAFRAFYDRTSRGIWAYLARVTGDRQVADDLVQETYYRFLRADAEHDSEAHRRNSLYRIATNLARDARRRSLTRPLTLFAGDEVDRIPVGDHGASTERNTDFHRAMDRLKPNERSMLWLAYAEGSSHKEIADVLGVSASSMKLMLFRARRKLAGLLKGDA